jgi:hypothetical protein
MACDDCRRPHPREIVEMAMAHAIENKVEATYRRGDALMKRRQLMDAWARYCATARDRDNVVPIAARR